MDKEKILSYLPSRNFNIVNLSVWLAVLVLNVLFQFINTQDFSRALYSIIPLVWCYIFTTLLRIFWAKNNIYKLNPKKLILILIPHSLIITSLIVILGIGLIILIRQDFNRNILLLMLNNFFSIYPVIVLWITFYFLIIYYKNLITKENDNLKLQNALQESLLLNLKNQLNPHFLFNALNDIRSLIREDPEKARTMINSLTDILRYSLNLSGRQYVNLSNEISFLQEYLVLEKLHMENRLTYEINIESSVTGALIPPMILQLLVENAIKHGINKIPTGGKITITGEKFEDKLRLRVTNDGKFQEGSAGIGIQNIKNRLTLLYGNKSSFIIKQENNNVKAEIFIPLEN